MLTLPTGASTMAPADSSHPHTSTRRQQPEQQRRVIMSQSIPVIVGLIAGIVAGMIIAAIDSPSLHGAVALIRPIGGLWLSALQMTVLPLMISLLITGIASTSDTASNGRLAARTLLLFLVFLAGAAATSALITPLLLALWPVDPDAGAALRASLSTTAPPEAPTLNDWFNNVVPTNPFKAAADGAILPLVVFAAFFGLAAARLKASLRATLLGFFEAIAETMLTIVKWVLWAAPAGVFALAIDVGLQGGAAAAGAITHYLILMCVVGLLITLAMYAVVALTRSVPLTRFARAALPAQAVGLSTQSSLASLPAMLTAAQSTLGLSPRVSGIVLPLAVSIFRVTSPPMNLAIVLFVAHVYGVELDAGHIAAGAVVCVVTSLVVVSLPSALTFFTTTVPISLAMGVPLQLLTILIAVEVIPDLFRTVGNVTADLTVTTIVSRMEKEPATEFDAAEA
jgi:proton glutamate symport protein